MASFNGSIDLLALNGAKVYTGIDQKNAQRAYVCIPVDVNDIKLAQSMRDNTKQVANVRVNIDPYSENYKNKVRQSNIERGDDPSNVPTHEVVHTYTDKYIKAVINMYPKMVEEVKEATKAGDPAVMTQDPQDTTTHLFKAIRKRMQKAMGKLYIRIEQQTAYQQPQSYSQAANVSAYNAPADGTTDYSTMPNDDDALPF